MGRWTRVAPRGALPRLSLILAALLASPLVPVARAQCTLTETQGFLADVPTDDDIFGAAVSVDGDVLVLANEYDDDLGLDSGSVFVYRHNGTTWAVEQKLTASDGAVLDNFGRSVFVRGDTLVVGAHWDDTPAGTRAGSAYVFRYDGAAWSEEQKLTAPDGEPDARFGVTVGLQDDVIVVGAWLDGANSAGAAYVFRDNGAEWVFEQKLTASDADAGDNFGRSVWIDGTSIAVTAHHDDQGGSNAGAAYVFTHDGLQWNEEQKILTPDASSNDETGFAVSLEGDVLLVGSHREDAAGAESGAAYVFRRTLGVWGFEQRLVPADLGPGDWCGFSVALRGGLAAVSAHLDDELGADCGAATLFRHDGASWVEQHRFLPSNGAAGDLFGFHLDTDGSTFATGSWAKNSWVGEGYTFDLDLDDYDDDGQPDVCQPLSADGDTISVGPGGSQVWTLQAGAAQAGDLYLVLGSLAGSSPGFSFGGVQIPLNQDGYTLWSANNPNVPPLVGSFGVLDGTGAAQGSLVIPPGSAGMAGLLAHHAYLAIDPVTLQVPLASNAMPLNLTP